VCVCVCVFVCVCVVCVCARLHMCVCVHAMCVRGWAKSDLAVEDLAPALSCGAHRARHELQRRACSPAPLTVAHRSMGAPANLQTRVDCGTDWEHAPGGAGVIHLRVSQVHRVLGNGGIRLPF